VAFTAGGLILTNLNREGHMGIRHWQYRTPRILRKTKKTTVEMACRRTFRMLASSQQSGKQQTEIL